MAMPHYSKMPVRMALDKIARDVAAGKLRADQALAVQKQLQKRTAHVVLNAQKRTFISLFGS